MDSKTYSNSEIFAMLEKNPKLQFESDEGYKVYVNLEENYAHDKDAIVAERISDGHTHCEFGLHDKWHLIEQEVPFMTAIKAYYRGKTIYIRINDIKHIYVPNGDTRGIIDENNGAVSANEIINGHWFIEGE